MLILMWGCDWLALLSHLRESTYLCHPRRMYSTCTKRGESMLNVIWLAQNSSFTTKAYKWISEQKFENVLSPLTLSVGIIVGDKRNRSSSAWQSMHKLGKQVDAIVHLVWEFWRITSIEFGLLSSNDDMSRIVTMNLSTTNVHDIWG